MIAYIVNQIKIGNKTYLGVITKKPDLKDQIDAHIEENGLVIDKTA